MTLRLLVAASLLPLLATGILVSAAVAGDGPGGKMLRLRGVNFVSSCTFSHGAPDDPIVAFGQPGASHHHSFVGNTGTNASSMTTSFARTVLPPAHRLIVLDTLVPSDS